jgi:HSP20 family protein
MYESLWSFPGGVLGEFDRLRRELDDVFGSAGNPASIRSAAPGAFPAINVGLTPNSVEVYAFAPGIDASKVEVVIDRGVLTISGERTVELPKAAEKQSVYKQERSGGSFKRAISLPDDVDSARVQATYRDGVLNVSIARREEAQPKRITVQ